MGVVYLDYQHDLALLGHQIRPLLQEGEGICVIRNFPIQADHLALVQLTESLGQPLLEAHNIDGGIVCAVEVDHESKQPAYANTPHVFPCHTDCSDFEYPPDTLLLLCERQATTGGESFWISLKEVLPHLSSAQIELLRQPVFHFRKTLYPILADWGIRYNRLMIELYRRLFEVPADELSQLMDQLDHILAQHQHFFTLQAGDCLCLNNYKLLHGRGEFDPNSDRLLKRTRLYLKS